MDKTQPPAEGSYKIGTVTRLTGFSAVLLRAWERRYRLLEPERGPGGHRMYTDKDLAVLKRVRDLLNAGRTIGELAALGRVQLIGGSAPSPPLEEKEHRPGGMLESGRRELVESALALDSTRFNRALDTLAGRYSPETLIDAVIQPVALRIGDLWRAGDCTIASEHLASAVFRQRILKLIETAESYAFGSAQVIATCLPGEIHELGILVLSYFVNRAGVRVVYLGNSLPLDSCRQAGEIARPDAFLLSVTTRKTFARNRSALLRFLAEQSERARVYLGGQGAPETDAELEGAGLHLLPGIRSGHDVSLRIASEVQVRRGRRGRRGRSRSSGRAPSTE